MDKGTVKKTFRNIIALLPMWVQRELTKRKIGQLTRHLMNQKDIDECVRHPERRDEIIFLYMKKYPIHTKVMDSKIADLFRDNPHYRDMSKEARIEAIGDMRFCYFAYGFNIDEYVFFDLGGKNSDDTMRKKFISDVERLCFRFAANNFTETIYADKASMYEFLKKYYKRDAVIIRNSTDYDKFSAFVHRHSSFVEKPVISSGGAGVKLVEVAKVGGGIDYFNSVTTKGDVLLEEVIVQSKEMYSFNPDSINTVRIMTFLTRGGVIAPFGFFRAGRKGSFVDNGAKGGVIATIDTQTGVICSEGCDESGNRFNVHPDSGQPIKGFVLPDWENAVQLCKEAALLTPKLKYLSWDLAYMDSGQWVVVEVNTSGQFLQQASTLFGIRDELKAIVKQMDLLVDYVL